MRIIDWQVDCRQEPCRRNKMSLSSSIICVDIHASKSSAFQRENAQLCVSLSLPQSQHCLAGGWRGQGCTDPFPAPSWGSNWKIWVALLVCFGGMWWVVFFWGFSSVPLLRRLWGESSDGGQAEPCLWSSTSLSALSALCSLPHLVASSLLTGLLGHWFSQYGFCDPARPRQTDRGAPGWENWSQYSSKRKDM